MAVFSTNQVRQFYVASTYVDDPADVASKGDISVACTLFGGKDSTSGAAGDKEIYFIYKGDTETPLKSDRIQVKNINYVKYKKASDMRVPLRKVKVTLAATPIAGQDYVLRIVFRQFYGMSDQDQYVKDAVVRATSAMVSDSKNFYKAMVKALNMAFSREVGATNTSNPYLEFSAGTSGSEDGIYIQEKEQEWSRGTQSAERVYFDVFPTTVFDGTDDVIWAAENASTGYYYTEVSSGAYIKNGKTLADMEYFYLGERGDQYRLKGWPNYIETKYQVDSTKEYDVLEIHFGFTDTGVNSYRTEKDITIIAPAPPLGQGETVPSANEDLTSLMEAFLEMAGLAEAEESEGGGN